MTKFFLSILLIISFSTALAAPSKGAKVKKSKYVEMVDTDEDDGSGTESILKKPSEIEVLIKRKKTTSTFVYKKDKRAKIRRTNRLLY